MWLDLKDTGISGLLLFGNRELNTVRCYFALFVLVTLFSTLAQTSDTMPLWRVSLSAMAGAIAVEPSQTNIELLQRNLNLNSLSNVSVLSGAVSDKVGKAKFHLSYQSNLNTFHDVGSGREHLSGQTIDVETLTITDLAQTFGAPDLIRMDVEGHEVAVLNGAMKAIKSGKNPTNGNFETHLSRYSSTNDMAAVLKQMFDLGYEVSLAASSWEGEARLWNHLGISPK